MASALEHKDSRVEADDRKHGQEVKQPCLEAEHEQGIDDCAAGHAEYGLGVG